LELDLLILLLILEYHLVGDEDAAGHYPRHQVFLEGAGILIPPQVQWYVDYRIFNVVLVLLLLLLMKLLWDATCSALAYFLTLIPLSNYEPSR
jgi:hypothetical protein